MPGPISIDGLDFNISSQPGRHGGEIQAQRPFRIAVLGDFSGRAQHSPSGPGPFLRVDRDNFEEVMRHLDVRLALPLSDSNTPPDMLRFKSIEDFHPDRIYERFPLFQTFHEARQKASDPAAFATAFKQAESKPRPAAPAPPPTPKEPPPDLSRAGLLDDILNETETRSPEPGAISREDSQWKTFLKDVAAPHSVPDTSSERSEFISGLDAAAGDYMRAILNYPGFKSLESIWRSLAFQVFRTRTDENLQIFLLDIGKAEVAEDLKYPKDLSSTELYRLLVAETIETPGAFPFSVIVGAYTFDSEPEDTALLGRLGELAHLSGAPFISAGSERILGCPAFADNPDPTSWHPSTTSGWQELRRSPDASWIGLVLPRFLLRLPYGADTHPIDRFEFEELSEPLSHEAYVWGNPAFACMSLLSDAFSRRGWEFRPGEIQDIERLPLHQYRYADETRIKPCAEVLFTQRTAELILDRGLMPLLSFKDTDRIRLARFQSISDPPTVLAGPWEMR